MEPLRVLLVDDHIMFRKGLASLLSKRADVSVAGEAGDGLEAMERARELVPDLIFMDINMPGCDGLDATTAIKRELPTVCIVMLTVADDDQSLFNAIRCGADGYLLKNMEPKDLYLVLEGVRSGSVPISGTLAAKILKEFRQPDNGQAQPPEAREELTAREVEILELVVEGASNKDISELLHISENTVKIHIRNVLEKLHLQNRVQAAVYAVRQGLVSNQQPANHSNR